MDQALEDDEAATGARPRADRSTQVLQWVKVIALLAGAVGVCVSALQLVTNVRAGTRAAEAVQEELRLTRNAQVSGRLRDAVDQLGSPEDNVRIGGLLGLERLVSDAAPDERTTLRPLVEDLLAAFVRHHAARGPRSRPPSCTNGVEDLGAADCVRHEPVLTALTILHRLRDPEDDHVVDLSGTDLRNTDLAGFPLDRALLIGVDLRSANLRSAGLRGANVRGALLNGARLEGGHLAKALMVGVDLRQAWLGRADLRCARLGAARLSGSHLAGAYLARAALVDGEGTGADLRGTDLDGVFLRDTQLAGAILDAERPLPLTAYLPFGRVSCEDLPYRPGDGASRSTPQLSALRSGPRPGVRGQ